MFAWLSKWPVVRQIRERKDGTGLEAMSEKTRAMHARIDDAEVARSICPYCGVGCGQLIFHKDGKLVSIEGDPESPISQGNLCPKGAASYQLLTHSRRETRRHLRCKPVGAPAFARLQQHRHQPRARSGQRQCRAPARGAADGIERLGAGGRAGGRGA